MSASGMNRGLLAEARRVMAICNACRYCEGYCPVFPAMERRRSFADADLLWLANLCHNCKDCWHACPYAPPHFWQLNLPATFAELRAESYAAEAFPRALGRLFRRGGLFACLAAAGALSAMLVLAVILTGPAGLSTPHSGPGAFYAVVPWGTMAGLGAVTFGWAVLALAVATRRFHRRLGGGAIPWPAWRAALRDAATTRHLGAEAGCNDINDRYLRARRHAHLATMWGFLLAFMATVVATFMDHLLGWEAPYPWYSLPVLLGALGGVGMLVGTMALMWIRFWTEREPEATGLWGMDLGFLLLLHLAALTGLILLLFRHTAAMGWMLAVHLGVVYALFVTLPYGKMAHAPFRLVALAREHAERLARGEGKVESAPQA